ncbi:MAG TPA: RNA-binding protein [Xanthobacteraceae bacterium]|nr:RNA-binding protein [Xanthobacteraceae bacterium]
MIARTQDIEPVIELDSGPFARERERLCVATRTVRPVSDLIRFVIGPDGEAVADVKSKLPGRGIWVTATRDAVGEAIKRKAFARGFRREVRLASDLVTRTERLLERAVIDALAVAGKAGLVAAGFAKSEAALGGEDVAAVLHAAEASSEGIRKLDAAMRRRRSGQPLVVIGFLSSAQLDLALNRPNVIHAALLAGPASETFLARCRRLERFRVGDQHNKAEEAAPN